MSDLKNEKKGNFYVYVYDYVYDYVYVYVYVYDYVLVLRDYIALDSLAQAKLMLSNANANQC